MKARALNILVVDDEPTITMVLSSVLRRLGHLVDTAANGREAIQCFERRPGHFEVLVTDHNMPEVTGLELVDYLREEGYEGKIVLMSGSLTPQLEKDYQQRRVDKILQKPFSMEGIAHALREMTDRWREGTA